MSLEPSRIEHLYRSYRVCVGYAIRNAEAKDIPAIQWFCSVTEPDSSCFDYQERFISGGSCLLLAELNEYPIGLIDIQLKGDTGTLSGLRILNPMRGFGVAQHLIDEAEKLCVHAGCKISAIHIPQDQQEARELLATMGYLSDEGDCMKKDIRWKSCNFIPDDTPAEELCRANIDVALG